MGVQRFYLTLNKAYSQYYPGEMITGKVHLTVVGEELVTGILVRFLGQATTHWVIVESYSGDGGESNSTYQYPYNGRETYFDIHLRILGDGVNLTKLSQGDTVIPFSFSMPNRVMPFVCQFENGSVFYGVQAFITGRFTQAAPQTEVLPFFIGCVADLNKMPGVRNSIQVEGSEKWSSIPLFCCCGSSKPCVIQTYTPKMGFCPGEVVPFQVNVNNQASSAISDVRVSIMQIWSFFAFGVTGKQFRQELTELQRVMVAERVNSGESFQWEAQGQLVVPEGVPPTQSEEASTIVQMGYELMVSFDYKRAEGCCCRDRIHSVHHPIIVGTIPLL